MRARNITSFAVIFAAICGGVSGCASAPPVEHATGLYYVPTAAIIQHRAASINPANVLLASDEDVMIGRADKYLEGALPESGISAFTIYTYDAQKISGDHGSVGYRYRWVVQQGISAPPAP